MSIDHLAANDQEMANNVIGGIDCVKEFLIHSDKCSARELVKLDEEYEKDLQKLRFKSRVNIWKFIKEDGRKEGDEVTGPPEDTIPENIIS